MSGEVTLELINDGTLNIASIVYENLYGVTNDSLENLNGQLEATNLETNVDVQYQHVQKNSFSGGGQVGGTANLDFFGGEDGPLGSGWFRGANIENADRYLPIPGASLKFYLPYEAHVLLFWTVTWVNDNNEGLKESRIALFLNDSETIGVDTRTITNTPFARRVRRTMYGGSDADAGGSSPGVTVLSAGQLQDRYKSRTWSGHCWVPATLAAGFHDVSLRLCAHGSIKQTRIRARSMKYVYFKYGATL